MNTCVDRNIFITQYVSTKLDSKLEGSIQTVPIRKVKTKPIKDIKTYNIKQNLKRTNKKRSVEKTNNTNEQNLCTSTSEMKAFPG